MKLPILSSLTSDVPLERQVVGAEAAALSKLKVLGFPVSPGFCVVTGAFISCTREALSNVIDPVIAASLPGDRFVVRTLSGDEQASVIAASQDYSVSDVTGDEVVSAVISCLQCAKSARNGGYARRNRNTPAITILVQRYVPEEVSGLAYSSNPMTGAEEVIIQHDSLEPSAESVLGFAVTRDGKIEQFGEYGGSSRIAPDQVRAVSTLCQDAQMALACSCEIRWAINGQRISILGARRIGPEFRAQPEDEWTRANIGEVVPDRLTPLSYSAWRKPMELLFRSSYQYFRLPVDDFHFIKNECGQLWYNIGAINHLTGMLGLPPVDVAIGTGPKDPSVSSESGLHPGRILRHACGLSWAMMAHARLDARISKSMAKLRSITQKYADRAAHTPSPRLSLDLAAQCYAEIEPFTRIYGDATSASFSTLALLQAAALRWLPPEFGIASLLSSTGIHVAGAGEMLQELRRDPHNLELAGEFLDRYGHRGWQEIEFMNPTWRELGDALWKTPFSSPDALAHDLVAPHVPLREAPVRLPDTLQGWRRAIFAGLLERANLYAVLRENVKHEFFRPIDVIRRLLRNVSRVLASEGRIASERDLYFLDIEDLEVLVSGARVPEMRHLAALRRRLWDRPRANRSDGSSYRPREVTRWHGFASSRGRVEGRARVLTSPHEISTIQRGDILVAECLDVGWFPLFSIIGGLVTSMGGVLSHPCVVARECALPAVVGISGITELVKSGSWLIVDGDRGIVEMVPSPETVSFFDLGAVRL